MEPSRRNVFLLACCQALLLTNAVTLIAVSSLVGYAIASNKSLATLPATLYTIGVAIAAFPASMFMKRVGRRTGFMVGSAFGAAGAAEVRPGSGAEAATGTWAGARRGIGVSGTGVGSAAGAGAACRGGADGS